MKIIKQLIKPLVMILCIFVLSLTFLEILSSTDNKYKVKPPFGQDGIITFSEEDIKNGSQIFLIDGWKVFEGPPSNMSSSKTVYIGEYANYSWGDSNKSPFGEATYRLTLSYQGNEQIVTLFFPELISEFTLYVNNEVLDQGHGNASATFLLKPGLTEVFVNVKNDVGYYSGMYYPGTLALAPTVMKTQQIKTVSYVIVFVMTLTLALFSIFLWKTNKAHLYRLFGLLCLAFCGYISYFFVHLLSIPFEKYWYLIEDIAFYFLIYIMVRLSMVCAKLEKNPSFKPVTFVTIFFPVISVLLYFLIPVFPQAVVIHGIIQDSYRIFIFIWLTIFSIYSVLLDISEYQYLLVGNMVFGIGLLSNLLNSNDFEPIYGFWQFEWFGIILVLIFAMMMIQKNKRVLDENEQLTNNLEGLVELRTHKLEMVLAERRHFFSTLAHDLKAPVQATQSYIRMIKTHSVDIDDELNSYLLQVEDRQKDIQRRVESLNTLTKIDKIVEKPELIDVSEFINTIYHNFLPEADVLGIYLKFSLPLTSAKIMAQREKLIIVMENLIYNAFSFTDDGGIISLNVTLSDHFVHIAVSDTGVGMAPEKLPLVFNRFYVGRNNKNEGSGLGLYIVKITIEELGGHVSVSSELGKGTIFTLTVPCVD